MELSRGPIKSAQKICLYGVEGIGKSYFASKFPNPVFIDTEGSTKHMDVARTPKPSSWTMLMQQVQYFKANPTAYNTLVIDTADWAERLCIEEICAKANKKGIEDFGYGKGYTYLAEEFGRLLNLLEELIEQGTNVLVTAHAHMRKFEQPDELGAYDRWEMKLQRKTAPLVKEWADMVLFANYKTHVINVDDQGAVKGKNKVQGGKRVMYTTHHPCWDAKNRHDLLPELPLDFDEIRHCIVVGERTADPAPTTIPEPEKPIITDENLSKIEKEFEQSTATNKTEPEIKLDPSIPKPLADLMEANNVKIEEIQVVVAKRGYYPINTPINNYDPQFITGVLVGAWEQVYGMILEMRNEEPF